MQRADPFFTLILFIFSSLVISFFAFDFHLSGIDVERQKVQNLSQQVHELQVKNEALQLEASSVVQNLRPASSRKIASVGPQKEISFDQLFKAQLTQSLKNKKVLEIRSMSQKIMDHSADQDLLAHALFANSYLSCELEYKEDQCFADVENLVQQFPESHWAGESLIKLSQLFLKQKKFKEAESVIKIVKVEFSKDVDLIKRINLVERPKL